MHQVRQVAHGDEEALLGIFTVLRIPTGGEQKPRGGEQCQEDLLNTLTQSLIGRIEDRILGAKWSRQVTPMTGDRAPQDSMTRGSCRWTARSRLALCLE